MTEKIYDLAGKRVWVAGHRGMVGSALLRRLASENCDVLAIERKQLDLSRQAETELWMDKFKPEVVVIAAAKVGGILANDRYPAEFIYQNMTIAANIIHSAWRTGVEKLLYLGSSCVYPKLASQPISEEALLTGPLEPTNQWYAVAKIAGIKLCQAYRRQYDCDFITAMPTNLFGPGDNYDLQTSHVMPALIRKLHEARVGGAEEVEIWGSGNPRREFLYVEDLADALVHVLQHYSGDLPLNLGTGTDITIRELAETLQDIIGFSGTLKFDQSKPDGTPRKLLDVSRLKALGWQPRFNLRDAMEATYQSFLESAATPVRAELRTRASHV